MKDLIITNKILNWYDINKRSLPWRNKVSQEKKQYFTLVSEFMLQQTQVATVIPYFNRFIKNIPNIEKLSKYNDRKLMLTYNNLSSIIDSEDQKTNKKSQEFNINNEKLYDNYKELIEDKDIDAICIGTWPYMHEVLVCESLKNNKHVMTEARMTFDYESAKRMLEFSKKSPNLITQIVPAPMTLKFDKYIRKLIGQNEIGEVIQVDISINHQTPISLSGGYPDFNSENHWRSDIDLSGMNTMQLGIWYEAMMRWVGSAKNVMSASDLIVKISLNI